MDEEMLDPFSRDFARILFAVYPEWRALAQAVPEPDGGPGALEVTVPAPDGSDLAAPLAVSTEGGEVTVYLGGSKPLPLDKTGSTSVEVGKLDALPGIIDALLAAVQAGELDAQLVAAAQERSKAFKRRTGATKAA